MDESNWKILERDSGCRLRTPSIWATLLFIQFCIFSLGIVVDFAAFFADLTRFRIQSSDKRAKFVYSIYISVITALVMFSRYSSYYLQVTQLICQSLFDVPHRQPGHCGLYDRNRVRSGLVQAVKSLHEHCSRFWFPQKPRSLLFPDQRYSTHPQRPTVWIPLHQVIQTKKYIKWQYMKTILCTVLIFSHVKWDYLKRACTLVEASGPSCVVIPRREHKRWNCVCWWWLWNKRHGICRRDRFPWYRVPQPCRLAFVLRIPE